MSLRARQGGYAGQFHGAGGAIKTKMSRIRPSKGLDDFIPSGSLRTGAADTHPATPETPASRNKLIQPFSRQNTECMPWFASFCATQNDFPVVVPPPDSVRQRHLTYSKTNS
jgi:hypothetical protein